MWLIYSWDWPARVVNYPIFEFLYLSTKDLIPLWEVDIMSDIEICLDGEGQGTEDMNSLDLGYIEDISKV